MTKRRSQRKPGHVVQRGQDSWAVVINLGKLPNGKWKQAWHSVKGTRADAEKKLRDLLKAVDDGTYIKPKKESVAAFAERWLETHVKPNLRPATYNNYAVSLRNHALPAIGALQLTALRPHHIQEMLVGLDLAPKTVKHVHTAMRSMLTQAVKWGLLASNPASRVDAPTVPRKEMLFWSPEEARQFLAAAKDDRLYAVFWLALNCGLRRGEVLGLKWDDVDWQRGTLSVRRALVPVRGRPILQEPKTAASIRSVRVGDDTLAVLREHRRRQSEERLALGLGQSPHGLMFHSVNDNPVDPRGIHRVLDKYVKAAGVRRIRFHDLRHTCATMLLAAGVHPKVVAERLGDRDVSVVMNIYSHVLPGLQEQAAAKLDELLR